MSAKKGRKSRWGDVLPLIPPTTAPPPASPGSGLEPSPRFRTDETGDVVTSAPPTIGWSRLTGNESHAHAHHTKLKRAKSRHHTDLGGGDADAFTFPIRKPVKNLWEHCCNEVSAEVAEANNILAHMGIPPVTYRRDKSYPITDFETEPDIETAKSKDFLDYYIFPVLLPAIQSLIDYAKTNKVLQCRYCAFNPLDYIVEYIFNNNPRAPHRKGNPTPLFEIQFVKSWLELYPRPSLPNWMIMTDDHAARILQRVVRGFLARCRPDVQEMRQFWKDYKKDMEDEKNKKNLGNLRSSQHLMSPYYDEIAGEWDAGEFMPRPSTAFLTHSDTCEFCQRFKVFLQYQQELMKDMKRRSSSMSYDEEEGEEFQDPERLLLPPVKNQHSHKNLKGSKKTSAVGIARKLKDAGKNNNSNTTGSVLVGPSPSRKKSVKAIDGKGVLAKKPAKTSASNPSKKS